VPSSLKFRAQNAALGLHTMMENSDVSISVSTQSQEYEAWLADSRQLMAEAAAANLPESWFRLSTEDFHWSQLQADATVRDFIFAVLY
jgi:hypothetical protein